MRRIVAALFLLLAVVSPLRAADLVVVSDTWPPYTDNELPGKGLAINLVTTALKRAGYPVSVKFESWPRTMEGVNIGVYDVIGAMWYTDERAKAFVFSEPYLTNIVKVVRRRDVNFPFNNIADLGGKRIGVVKDYAYGKNFDSADFLTTYPSNHVIHNLLDVSQGKLDATLDDELVLRFVIKRYLGSMGKQLEILPKPVSSRGLRIAVSKANPDHQKIVASFNQAMAQMRNDGTFKKIVQQYRY
jgi:polar amino acid transport system substrate-binding protein